MARRRSKTMHATPTHDPHTRPHTHATHTHGLHTRPTHTAHTHMPHTHAAHSQSRSTHTHAMIMAHTHPTHHTKPSYSSLSRVGLGSGRHVESIEVAGFTAAESKTRELSPSPSPPIHIHTPAHTAAPPQSPDSKRNGVPPADSGQSSNCRPSRKRRPEKVRVPAHPGSRPRPHTPAAQTRHCRTDAAVSGRKDQGKGEGKGKGKRKGKGKGQGQGEEDQEHQECGQRWTQSMVCWCRP